MKKSICDALCVMFVLIIGIIVIFIGIGESDSKPNDKSKVDTYYTENVNNNNYSDEKQDSETLYSKETIVSVELQSALYNEIQSAKEIIISVTIPANEENGTISGEVNQETYMEVNQDEVNQETYMEVNH